MSDGTNTEPDIAEYQRVLAGMIDLGSAVARKLAARIDDASNADAVRIANAFECVSRTVRRCILLSTHLLDAAAKATAARASARLRILREVSDAISHEKLSPDQAEKLHLELVERLDAPDLAAGLDVEINTRALGHIILDLKRDMGLGQTDGLKPWPRRSPDDIADFLLCANRPTQPWPPDPHSHPPS